MFIYIYILSYYKLFLYFNLCLSVMLDSLSYSFTLICVLSVILDNLSCSFKSISFLLQDTKHGQISFIFFIKCTLYKLMTFKFQMKKTIEIEIYQEIQVLVNTEVILNKFDICNNMEKLFIYIL
jgi:hypothetical protein